MGGFWSLQLSFLALIPCPSVSFSRGNSGGPERWVFISTLASCQGSVTRREGCICYRNDSSDKERGGSSCGRNELFYFRVCLQKLTLHGTVALRGADGKILFPITGGEKWKEEESASRKEEHSCGTKQTCSSPSTLQFFLLAKWTHHVCQRGERHKAIALPLKLVLPSSLIFLYQRNSNDDQVERVKENESRSPHPPKI